MIYKDFKRNHVILPGREKALSDFINKLHNNKKLKLKNSISSNSEDALTWSCFDVIAQLPFFKKIIVLDEILEDSFQDAKCNFTFTGQNYHEGDIHISVGENYRGSTITENTEVDASIETPDKVIFFEAKLYSSISLADESKSMPHDQIIRKLRVGLEYARLLKKEFYFIFLDIAPAKELLKFTKGKSKERALDNAKEKWKSAWFFNRYKKGSRGSTRPLADLLKGIDHPPINSITGNMGWLTWADLFKIVMRGMI